MPEFYLDQIIRLLRSNEPDAAQLEQIEIALQAARDREEERLMDTLFAQNHPLSVSCTFILVDLT